MKILAKINTIFDHTLTLLSVLACVLIIFVIVSVDLEVFMRYFLRQPLKWVVEISGYSLLYITFLVAACVLKREGHVKMDLVINRLEPRTHLLLNIITSITSAIVCLVIAWYGVKVTWEHFQIGFYLSTPLKPPSFLIVIIVPVGSFLLFIQFLRRTYGYMGSWRALPNKQYKG